LIAEVEMDTDLIRLGACDAARQIREGTLTSARLVQACLERIKQREPVIHAWTHLDAAQALAQAEARDQARRNGEACGPLHGLPIGIKDIFDTRDMPTENGTVLHAGRRPRADAHTVSLLRAAGAVILGKTVTTELAVYSPGKTRNPRNPAHTPGGSSSGSAAAVADLMLPAALGTQTNGSMIRPAAYCGVIGYKPTFGLISRAGVLHQSTALDQIGVFSRTVEDAALLASVLFDTDPGDEGMARKGGRFEAHEVWEEAPAVRRFGFTRSPFWEEADPAARAAFLEMAKRLEAEELRLPPAFDTTADLHRTILEFDLARSFAAEYAEGKDRLSDRLRQMIERGQHIPESEYDRAVRAVPVLQQTLDTLLAPYDAVLTPATTGEAPAGLSSTGSPIFCTLWTLCHVPAITVPLLTGPGGLPLGVQLVGARQTDLRLLRAARDLLARSR
jgi:Asp-tRNA(Asn)/Glu-tRNA(Gln) amidotransferase A subunit family amidase